MKKTLQKLTYLFLLTLFLVPFLVSAQDGPLNCCEMGKTVTIDDVPYEEGDFVGNGEVCHLGDGTVDYTDKKWTLICLICSISIITDWVFGILMTCVSAMVIFGAYLITTAGGSPDNMTKGKNFIMYALIGLVVGLFSRGFPDLIAATLGL